MDILCCALIFFINIINKYNANAHYAWTYQGWIGCIHFEVFFTLHLLFASLILLPLLINRLLLFLLQRGALYLSPCVINNYYVHSNVTTNGAASCYSVDLRDNHSCVENSMKSHCPICYEVCVKIIMGYSLISNILYVLKITFFC